MDRTEGDDPLHQFPDNDFIINFLNNDTKCSLGVQNPLMGNYSHNSLFVGGDIGYQTGLSNNAPYSQYHNLEDISKYVSQQNTGLGETTDYYSQHMRKNNSYQMHSNQAQQMPQNTHSNLNSLNQYGQSSQQQHNQHSQQGHNGGHQQNPQYLYQPPHNIKQEQNQYNQMQITKLEDQSISEYSNANYGSTSNSIKKPEYVFEKNKNLFNYKNNLKNTYINKISSLITDNPKSKSKERPAPNIQEQPIQQQWYPKDPKQQADEIFKEPLKPGQFGYPQNISNIGSNFKVPTNANVQMNPQQLQQQLKKVRSFDALKVDEIEKMNQKLARNRESARNSRKRKKIYIELLETKVATISEELEKTKRVLETNNQYLNKLSFQTQILNGFIFGRQQLYEKIEKAIQSQAEENEINLMLDSLRFRLGAAGKERITAVNYFFKQILDICVPTHYRYLLWSSQEALDMFNEEGSDADQRAPWRQELMNTIGLSEQQKKQMQKFKKRFTAEKQKLDELIEGLNQMKKQIQTKTQNVENIIDDMRNVFTPNQNAKFLVFLEKNKYRREISNIALWEAFKKENGEYDFDEEGQSDSSLLNQHLLGQQPNLPSVNGMGGGSDLGFISQYQSNGAGMHNSMDSSDINQMSDDDEESHVKVNDQEGPRKKVQIQQGNSNVYM
ncbi:hypothetical protein ABPG72_010442 [Tetrahymena utriculariae]